VEITITATQSVFLPSQLLNQFSWEFVGERIFKIG